ncbi:MAG: nitrogen regulation protein NR(II) [Bdellovibrionales bacterium]
MSSAVLLVTPPTGWTDDFGNEKADSLSQAMARIRVQPWGGIAIFTAKLKSKDVQNLLELIKTQDPTPAVVLITPRPEAEEVWAWLKLLTPLRLVAAGETDAIVESITALIEHSQLQSQEEQRRRLVAEQNYRLQQLNRDLETRVERRQKTLKNARQRLLVANQHIEILHAASLAIHRARALGELENSLCEALRLHMKVSAIRIRFRAQSTLAQAQQGDAFSKAFYETLVLSGVTIGELAVFPQEGYTFSESDINLLHQIAETAALGVDRLAKLEQAEVLKQQWQATFDSISEPLCLTDANFNILRTNRSYAKLVGRNFNTVLNKNCFAEFFDSKTATELNRLGRVFKARQNRWVQDTPHTYEISTQPLHFESLQGEVTLVLFRDISSRLQIERQLLESSKMAELGLIGSSIAHELNNPLGGMLSFIQLIRMGLKGNEPYAEDIAAMEDAANRCREIIQRLLGFARKSDASDRRTTDLREVLKQALSITELLTRSQGIVVEVQTPEQALPLEAQANQLSQALCNLVQNAAEAILEKRRQDPRAMGKIQIQLQAKDQGYVLEIHDSGIGIAPEVQDKIFNPLFSTKSSGVNSGLGLTMSYKIISEHGGRLEISSQPGVGTTARIAFQSLDLKSSSQVFDSKI